MTGRNLLCACFCAAILLVPRSGCFAQAKEARELVEMLLNPPKVSFVGKKLTVTWHAKKSNAKEMKVYFKPPGKWRHEVLAPSGKTSKVLIQNKNREWHLSDSLDVVIERDVDQYKKGMLSRDALIDMILANFKVTSAGTKMFLGKNLDIIKFHPKKAKSGPQRILWIDAETGIVYKKRHSNHAGSLVRESHFTFLEMNQDIPDEKFAPSQKDTRPIAREISRELLGGKSDIKAMEFGRSLWLQTLPHGYHLRSAAVVPIMDTEVLHYRYTNGLSTLSLFVSSQEISAQEGSISVNEDFEDIDFSASSWAGNVLKWSEGEDHFVLVGDLSKKALKGIRKIIISPYSR
ncbi:hypothetical protein ACFL6Y_08025 [Elusimicrobiota bacterium]